MKLATLCYVKKDGKTLMLHRMKRSDDVHIGKWNGLGGKIHMGETPEECVIREVKEESGLEIRNPSLRGILTFPAFKNEEDWYVYAFTANEFTGELVDSEEGTLEWVDDKQVYRLPLWEGDPIFLKWIEESRFFSGKFTYRDGKLIHHSVVFHDSRHCERSEAISEIATSALRPPRNDVLF
jgi:8-oxo-dGTP diphosphatase